MGKMELVCCAPTYVPALHALHALLCRLRHYLYLLRSSEMSILEKKTLRIEQGQENDKNRTILVFAYHLDPAARC